MLESKLSHKLFTQSSGNSDSSPSRMTRVSISRYRHAEQWDIKSQLYDRAFFNIYTGGIKALPQSLCCSPPLKGFGSPSNVPFCLKMSENHAEIAGNQVNYRELKNTKISWGKTSRPRKREYFSTFPLLPEVPFRSWPLH